MCILWTNTIIETKLENTFDNLGSQCSISCANLTVAFHLISLAGIVRKFETDMNINLTEK